jgi:outer membrane protein assembly factor BamE (lipoprotein component of BamABCDE complex)
MPKKTYTGLVSKISSNLSFGMTGIGVAVLLTATPLLTSCTGTAQTFSHGYQASPDTLDLVSEGSSREQVLLALGTPSTTINQEGEVFYYISQKKRRSIAFAKPKLIEQKVMTVYFNEDQTVSRIANYGLKDGKVFDYITRTTPTGGKDISFLSQLLGAAATAPIKPFGG